MSKDAKLKTIEAAYQIPGWLWPRECFALYELAAKSRCHVEIGSYCGKSLWVFAHGMPKGSVIHTIDPHDYKEYNEIVPGFSTPSKTWAADVFAITVRALQISRPDLIIEHHTSYSMSVALELFQSGFRADSVYLDAEHQLENAQSDIQYWLPVVNNGGFISGHDYCPREPGVVEAVNTEFDDDFYVMQETRIWVHEVK
jgi:hypothetical protein